MGSKSFFLIFRQWKKILLKNSVFSIENRHFFTLKKKAEFYKLGEQNYFFNKMRGGKIIFLTEKWGAKN